MENFKKKVQQHELYADVYNKELVVAEAKILEGKLRKKFLLWLRDEHSMSSPHFKVILPRPNDETSVEYEAQTNAVCSFAEEAREDGFHAEVISKRNEDGTHFFDIEVHFISPKELEKSRSSKEYKEMREEFRDLRYRMGIMGEVNKLFEKHCCTGKMKYLDHPDYRLFSKVVKKVYDDLLKAKKIPQPEKRVKGESVAINDEKTKETAKILMDAILWKKIKGMTVIEAFSKGKIKKIKKEFNL